MATARKPLVVANNTTQEMPAGDFLSLSAGGTGVTAASAAALLTALSALQAANNLGDIASVPSALANLGIVGTGLPDGCCRLSVTNTTTITMAAWNGSTLIVNGVQQTIPAAGVALANTGLSARTLYYLYAAMSGTTMVLNATTTGYVRNAAGQAVKSGDAGQRLVGMCFPNGSSQFVDSTVYRGLLNYFNRRTIVMESSGSGVTGSSSPVTIFGGGSGNSLVMTWGDEAVTLATAGNVSLSAAGATTTTYPNYDGTSVGSGTSGQSYAAGAYVGISGSWSGVIPEGPHTAYLAGQVSAGTGSWTGEIIAATRG